MGPTRAWSDPLEAGKISGVGRAVDTYAEGQGKVKNQVRVARGWHRWSDRRKIRFLRSLSEDYGRDPELRKFVIHNVISGVPDRDYKGQAAAILRYVQQNVRYVNEYDEVIQSPWYTLRNRFGDCDDMAVLINSMAQSIHLPWKFALAGRDRRGRAVRWVEGEPLPWGVRFQHVYSRIGVDDIFAPKKWMSAEPTLKGVPLGFDVIEADQGTAASVGISRAKNMAGPGSLGSWGNWGLQPHGSASFDTSRFATSTQFPYEARRSYRGYQGDDLTESRSETPEPHPLDVIRDEGAAGIIRHYVHWPSIARQVVEGVISFIAITWVVNRLGIRRK